MRVLYLYCHPLEDSFHGAIRARALAGLARAGHAVDLLDLYAEGFDPVLGAEARRAYHDTAANLAGVADYARRLSAAEGRVVQFRRMLGYRRLAGITTYGRPWSRALAVGDPPKRWVTRYLRLMGRGFVRTDYLARYHMNVASADRRGAFLDRVEPPQGRV